MLQVIAHRKGDPKRRSAKGPRRKRAPSAVALAVREFAAEIGLDFEALKDDARGAVFERFATFQILRRFHESELEPAHVDRMIQRNVAAGEADPALSAVALLVNGRMIESVEAADAALEEADRALNVQIVAIRATRSNRFDADQMERFVDAAAEFVEGVDGAEGVSETRGWLAHLRRGAFYSGLAVNLGVYAYFAALGNWVEATPSGALERGRRRIAGTSWLKNANGDAADIEVEAVDRGRLLDLMATGLPLHQLTDQTAEFAAVEDYAASLPASGLIALPSIKGVEVGFSGHVPVSAYLALLEREDGQGLREAIFTQNVRGYQGDGGVNARIRETLGGKERAQFLLRNNGVTIVADRVERLAGAAGDGDQVLLENFQIVNGLQTSTVIYRMRDELRRARDVHVPVKIVAATEAKLRRAIIDATNRQTPITGAALFAACEKAVAIERYFLERLRAGGPPIVLERRSGQYAKSLPADRVSLEDLLRAFYAVFLEQPHLAERGYAAIAAQVDDGLLAPSLTAEPYYLAARLAQFARDVAAHRDEPRLAQLEHHAALGLRILCAPSAPPLGDAAAMRDYCRRVEAQINADGRRDALADQMLAITQSPRDRMRNRIQGVAQLKRTREHVVEAARRLAPAESAADLTTR